MQNRFIIALCDPTPIETLQQLRLLPALSPKMNTLIHPLKPDQQEIIACIQQIQQRYPHNYLHIIGILFSKFGQAISPQAQASGRLIGRQEGVLTVLGQDSDSGSHGQSIRSDTPDMLAPIFQRVEKEKIERFKATPTKYQVQEEFLRKQKKNQLSINPSVYSRYGGYQKKRRPSRLRADKNYEQQIQLVINKARQWKQSLFNREHRIYASKIAPKFKSPEEEVRYYEKRLAARAYCERGYGLSKVQEEYSQTGGPVNMEKKRYKTVSTGFIGESYRRFEVMFCQNLGKHIRPLTGPEMRSLYSVLLNAQANFKPSQFDCFRKCVKLAYDLGSVSIYQQQAINFFFSVQNLLRDHFASGDKSESQFKSVKYNSSHPTDIYAPVEGGVHEGKELESSEVNSPFDSDYLTFGSDSSFDQL